MFPTILSSMNFDIEKNRLGFGTDLFSDKETLVESMGLNNLNVKLGKISSHLMHESYLLKRDSK